MDAPASPTATLLAPYRSFPQVPVSTDCVSTSSNPGPQSVDCAEGIIDLVGRTPLVRLRRYLDNPRVDLIAKIEAMNPGGSAKDRPALRMLETAIENGLVNSRTTVIESSSGNMGIALAQACRYFDIPFVCVVDPNVQEQNLAIMRALGARIVAVDAKKNGSYLAARLEMIKYLQSTIPHSYWPNQYANTENPASHYHGTIGEIWRQVNGDLDYLFVATSSTGTISGCSSYLRERGAKTKVVAVDAVGSVLFGGHPGHRSIPGIGAGVEPELAKHTSFDFLSRVHDLDCITGCRRAASREAMLIGGSAGGVLEAIRTKQDELDGKRCVAILHDSGTRYVDTIFDDEWVTTNFGIDPHKLTI